MHPTKFRVWEQSNSGFPTLQSLFIGVLIYPMAHKGEYMDIYF